MNTILEADIFTLPYVSFLAGLVFCLLGRKLLGVIVIIFGFFIGYTWGAVLLSDIMGRTMASSPWIPWVAGAAGAAVGLLAWKVSMFFAGAVIGLFIARGLFPSIPGIAHAGISLLAGILVQVYKDPIISLLTAIAGAYIAAGSAVIMLNMVGFLDAIGAYTKSSSAALVITIVLTLIFTFVGYKFQTRDLNT
ncbi:MAG: hypothetical protein K8S15_09625 [Candidatus Aegiribacteria sp.]|nr:hypothetical protein [Candidatus Aegiribacteria sp.]